MITSKYTICLINWFITILLDCVARFYAFLESGLYLLVLFDFVHFVFNGDCHRMPLC